MANISKQLVQNITDVLQARADLREQLTVLQTKRATIVQQLADIDATIANLQGQMPNLQDQITAIALTLEQS